MNAPVYPVSCKLKKMDILERSIQKVCKTLSDVLYEANCGRNGGLEPLDIERSMKAANQSLPREDSGEILADSDIENLEAESESEDQEDRPDPGGRPRRVVCKVAW